MKKSTEQLQKIKELAISKRKEFLSVGECGSCEVDESIDTLTYKLDTIIAESMPRDAFQEIAQIVREHHEWHKEELENPFFFPILLAPLGNSYDLLDSDPQLRIENTSSTPANITSKLYFIYQNHVRRLIANDSGVQVDL